MFPRIGVARNVIYSAQTCPLKVVERLYRLRLRGLLNSSRWSAAIAERMEIKSLACSVQALRFLFCNIVTASLLPSVKQWQPLHAALFVSSVDIASLTATKRLKFC